MDFFSLGEHITVKDLNAITYLLRKFKRLNAGLTLGALTLESDYGSFVFDKPLTSVGGNFIIEQEVNVSSSDCLRNCFYSFVFSVIDVNTSGTVNKRTVKVTGGTGDDGTLFVTLPTDLIESDEVILPNFEVDIVFDEHEYYTPVVDVVNVELVSDKLFVGVGETATVTATLTDSDGELLVGVPCTFIVNGVAYSETTDSDGQAEYQYTGTGVSSKIDIRVVTTRLTIYDSVMTATVTGGSVRLGKNMMATGDIIINWGDGTTTTKNMRGGVSHTYTDGLNEHTICFVGEITNLGEYCFIDCTGLTSVSIPNTVTSLGGGCFQGCTGLTSVIIPNSVTSLGWDCFQGCTGLTSVIIPNSVESIGDFCFNGCAALIDYQLYWKDSAIIEYDSNKMLVHHNTYFTIPQGQRTQYLNKNYPNKIKIRGYDLSLSTDKTVITEDETSTVTATLTYNMEPIADETVSYTIRQGATVIDTGTDTTDSNGQIEIEYTGTSTGKITIQITYDTLTETINIYDSTIHLQANNTDKTILQYNTYATVTTTNNRLQITTDTSANATYAGIDWYNNTITYHDIGLTDLTSNTYNLLLKDFQTNNKNIWRVGVYVKQDGGWQVLKTSPYLTNGDNLFEFTVPSDATALWVRVQTRNASNVYECSMSDWVLYPVGGSGKISTSLSIGSDKASYYTDESILLTGSLTDEDDLPLVGADVKVYHGASLVDTVSTDSTGTYEKSITGLSAGSYSFKAQYDGDDTYQASTSSSLSVIVQNHSYSLSIGSDKQIILTTESVIISGQLLKDSCAYASQSVELYDGVTKIATLTTDSDGEYEETVSGLSVGVHTFKAINSNVESSTISITVNEPTPVHDYSLSVASTKDILSYADSESATITATLTDNSVAVSGETLSYTIKHGATVIDSGSDTTDSSGQISFTYTSSGVGDVSVEVDFGTLLQETFVLQDLVGYYPSSYNSKSTVNLSLPTNYEIKFIINSTSYSTSSGSRENVAYLRFDSSNGVYLGKGSSGNRNISGSGFSGNLPNTVPIDTDTEYTFTKQGSTITLTDGSGTITGTTSNHRVLYILNGSSDGTLKNIRVKAL